MSERLTSANAEGVFEPFQIGRVPRQEFLRGERFGMRYQHLSAFGGGTQISVAMEVLEPGRQANQAHYHMLEGEHVFILEGSLTVRLGPKSYVLCAGYYVCFPARQEVGHALFNHTSAPCRYLVLGNPQPQDAAVFRKSGRVGVKLLGESYRKSATMEYWEGVAVDSDA